MPPLRIWKLEHPRVSLTVFIDDLCGRATSQDEHKVVGRLTAAAASLWTTINTDLDASVAEHKSVILASSDSLLDKLRFAFGKHGGVAVAAASNLGVDLAAGRRRASRPSTRTIRKRQSSFIKRCRRLRALKRAGLNMRTVFVTGLQAFSHYGAEVVGLDTAQLRTAHANYLGLVGSSVKSASTNLALLALGDPLWRQALAPALTWSSICWKAANDRAFQANMDLPRLGALAGPVVERLPTSWGSVRGPLGAASRSLARVGWKFVTPFILHSGVGINFPLTSTSPAMISYHLQVSWARLRGRAAASSIGVSGQLDAKKLQSVLKGTSDSGYPAILRAYVTQGLWSAQRLHNVGYDVTTACIKCGANSDTLHHRLFHCSATSELRQEILNPSDIDLLQQSASLRSLLMGFQVMPDFEPQGPDGLGCEAHHRHTWTFNGQPIEQIMEGTVFTDGACTKPGPVTWNRTGWAVAKVNEQGDLLAAVSGTVGRQLPQTPAAAEYIAALVASEFPRVQIAFSDYKNLHCLESLPLAAALHPKGVYSGIRRRIRGGMAQGFKIQHCKGHVDPDSCRDDPEARFKAQGNGHADRVAGAAAAATQQPSQTERQRWLEEADFLGRWLRYVPRALVLWPSAKPSVGHRSLPRREGEAAPMGRSFASDLMGPWAAQADAQTRREQRAAQSSGASQGSLEGVPPPTPPARDDRDIQSNIGHDWHWQAGRWLCTACLSSSRGAVPRRDKCPGLAANVRKLLTNPRGHKLQIATFTDSFGIVVICSACGHFCTSNRAGPLHKDDCRAIRGQAFASPGARSAYKRVSVGKHPRHAKGDAKVLDPCFPATALLAFERGGGQPTQGPRPT